MDPEKTESIRSWIAKTGQASPAQRDDNVIALSNLRAHLSVVDASFSNTSPSRATHSTFHSIHAPSAPPKFDFRPHREGVLIDLRTSSEIDRDEFEARARHSTGRLPVPVPRPASPNYNHQPNPSIGRQPRRFNHNNRRRVPAKGRHNKMAESKPQYLPPHMRNRPAQPIYVPPHMRKAPQKATESHEGGVSLNDNVAIDNGVTFNDGAAGDGGVGPRVGEDAQSSTQPTTAPHSAATAPFQSPEQVQQTDESTNAWGQTPPPTVPQAMMDNRHSQKQDNTYIRSKRSSKWATNKEIRERVMKDSNEHIGAWGSNGSDTGFNSNPAADPQHDIKKLVDWEGNWLPGPTDWESRRSFHHHNFNEEMMRFVYGSIDKDATVDVRNEPSFLTIPNGEVAPRAWASIRIEGTSLQEWWSNHVGSSLAEPDSKAWWRDYISEESSLLVPYHVPEAKVDPADTEGQILYVHDLGSGHASDKLMERRNKKKADRERRNAREREQHAALAAEMKPATFEMPEKIKPKISLYIRPALAADAHQIAGIYNHYVDESIRSAEVMPLSALNLSQRIADETASGMPWLVACQKGRKAGRGYTNGTDAVVLGFACASDFLSRQSMYAFTAEAEIYVHHNYLRHRIGSCLMDRLLYVLDPLYDSPGGYQFTGTGPFAEHGGSRVIGSVIMNVPFDKKDPADLKSVVNFLSKFGLKKEAELANIGVKQEMHVSLAVFRYTTGNTIDPKSAILR